MQPTGLPYSEKNSHEISREILNANFRENNFVKKNYHKMHFLCSLEEIIKGI